MKEDKNMNARVCGRQPVQDQLAARGWRWPRPKWMSIGSGLAVVAILAVLAPSALASKARPQLFIISGPGESLSLAPAANEETGHIYIGSNEGNHGWINNFGADGSLDPTKPKLTGPDGQPTGMAVDNSGLATQGFLYAGYAGLFSKSGPEAEYVQQYDAEGAATSVAIHRSDIPPDGTPQSGGLPPVVNPGGGFFVSAVAVGSEGNVFVVNSRGNNPAYAIDKFSPAGAFIAQYGAGSEVTRSLIRRSSFNIAPTAGGDIYFGTDSEVTIEAKSYPPGIYGIGPSGECLNGCTPIGREKATTGVVFDPANGNLVALENLASQSSTGNTRVSEYEPSGALVSESGLGTIENGFSLTVDGEADRVIVADYQDHVLRVFGPAVTFPDVITEGASAVTAESATLNGKVGAAGVAGATCVFEYVDQAHFKASAFAEAERAPCEPAGPFSGEALETVHANLSELAGGTTYRFRLVGTNGSGSKNGDVLEFTTQGPRIDKEAVGAVTETSVELQGLVNPLGLETDYRFEYVTERQFEEDRFAQAIEVPVGGEAIGAGSEDVAVSQTIEGLLPGTSYRFRLVASNASGTAHGEPRAFQPFLVPVPGLPDGRAYEQVSPVQKNGNNAQGLEYLMKAAPNGNAITYFITGGGIEGSEGGQEFPVYVAERGSSSWTSHGLLPPASFGERFAPAAWGEDPSISYPLVWSSGGKSTLYERVNATGQMRAIASGMVPENDAFVAGEADGGAKVLFESQTKLLPSAIEGKFNLYLWSRESDELSLVSVLPNGTTAPDGAIAGPYNVIGKDLNNGGGRIETYLQDMHVLSEDGSTAFFTTPGDAQLYARTDASGPDATTLHVSASQKTNGSGPGGTDPHGSQPAAFVGASADGRFAFFTSSEELTNDARTVGGAGDDLYRYDTETEELTDLAPDPSGAAGAGADVKGVLGTSADGSYVYFVANGVLAAGAKPGNCTVITGGLCNLYVWHAGAIDFVARIDSTLSQFGSGGQNWMWSAQYNTGTHEANQARVTPDGRTLLFVSREAPPKFAPGPAQIYRYRAGGGGELDCVSCSPVGREASEAAIQRIPSLFVNPREPRLPAKVHALSDDGDRVFFQTAERLVANDVNGKTDVYEWEADGTGSCEGRGQNGGCLYLISTGTGNLPAYFADASANGNDAFFFTKQRLVGQDTDELQDLYDARVGGGIAGQNPPPPNPCSGEGCLGPAQSAPSPAPVGTATFVGPPNPKPKHHPPHHRAKKKHRYKHRHHTRKDQKGNGGNN